MYWQSHGFEKVNRIRQTKEGVIFIWCAENRGREKASWSQNFSHDGKVIYVLIFQYQMLWVKIFILLWVTFLNLFFIWNYMSSLRDIPFPTENFIMWVQENLFEFFVKQRSDSAVWCTIKIQACRYNTNFLIVIWVCLKLQKNTALLYSVFPGIKIISWMCNFSNLLIWMHLSIPGPKI